MANALTIMRCKQTKRGRLCRKNTRLKTHIKQCFRRYLPLSWERCRERNRKIVGKTCATPENSKLGTERWLWAASTSTQPVVWDKKIQNIPTKLLWSAATRPEEFMNNSLPGTTKTPATVLSNFFLQTDARARPRHPKIPRKAATHQKSALLRGKASSRIRKDKEKRELRRLSPGKTQFWTNHLCCRR